MLGNLNGWHALILLAVVLLLFGAAKLPALARSVGQSVKILRSESSGEVSEPADPDTSPANASATVLNHDAMAAQTPQQHAPRE